MILLYRVSNSSIETESNRAYMEKLLKNYRVIYMYLHLAGQHKVNIIQKIFYDKELKRFKKILYIYIRL